MGIVLPDSDLIAKPPVSVSGTTRFFCFTVRTALEDFKANTQC